jgi:prefoldin subunit 5
MYMRTCQDHLFPLEELCRIQKNYENLSQECAELRNHTELRKTVKTSVNKMEAAGTCETLVSNL